MSILPMVAMAASLALIFPTGSAPGIHINTEIADFRDQACYYVDSPRYQAATMCLQVDDSFEQQPRWTLRNNTEWVLDLDSPGAWSASIPIKPFPTRDDLRSYFTRLWTNDQERDVVAVQPGETVFMPAPVSFDGRTYPFPEGELRFNAEATAAMVALASAVASADKVARDRSKLYKIVKRAKACATAGAAALLATDQTSDAYAVVLADLAAYKACDKYLRGVAKQAKKKAPSSWRMVAVEFGDNFFIQARTAAIKLFQFAPRV